MLDSKEGVDSVIKSGNWEGLTEKMIYKQNVKKLNSETRGEEPLRQREQQV